MAETRDEEQRTKLGPFSFPAFSPRRRVSLSLPLSRAVAKPCSQLFSPFRFYRNQKNKSITSAGRRHCSFCRRPLCRRRRPSGPPPLPPLLRRRRSRRGSRRRLPAALVSPPAALAAYGDAARVFGSRSVETTFLRYEGDGFTMSLPAKWSQPLREKPYPGTVAAFNDSGDTSNQIFVVAKERQARQRACRRSPPTSSSSS